MKKIKVKRVCLVSPSGLRMDLAQDFLASLPDWTILAALHEVGKTVWIGDDLYKLQRDDGIIRHYKYEVYTIIRRIK